METEKVPMAIDKDHLETAPDYIKVILDDEMRETNTLVHISGFSMCYPNGEIAYDIYKIVFYDVLDTVRLYRVSKWADMPVNTNMVWLDKKELEDYLDIMEGVKF